jgi:selenoprotein W-related protein
LTAKVLPRFKRAITRYELIPSKGGCFELTVGGKLLYSKLATGTFPDEAQILSLLETTLEGPGR